MRINNNMLALNTHRQLGSVSLRQSRSMEKLSSGYRINRAGDDAAGLAISEKMRAQLRGLTTAAKNAQDGISLIQTAEGALQEVHGMLNRMVELATQSANGTMDDEVDRKNIESELIALKKEITRVAKSSNFNGIELLDGSLASSAVKNKIADVNVNGVTGLDTVGGANTVITYEKASEAKFSGMFKTSAHPQHANLKFGAEGDTIKSLIFYKDDAGVEHKMEISLVSDSSKKVDWTKSKVLIDGNEVSLANQPELNIETVDNKHSATTALKAVLEQVDGFRDKFDVKVMKDAANETTTLATIADSVFIKIEAKNAGTDAEVTSISLNGAVGSTAATHNTFTDVALSDVRNIKGDKITIDGALMFSLKAADLGTDGLEDAIKSATINVDGEAFIFVQKAAKGNGEMVKLLKDRGFDERHIVYSDQDAATNMDGQDVKNMATAINDRFGKKLAKADGTKLIFEAEVVKGKSGEGLTLQVGESSEDFQKITVMVGDMSSKGLKIDDISVATQEKAAASISKIREAINNVSSTRGDLGALQNRLEHTIANLNVTAENITASESRIRDVDMAKEMVELTKLNILQQAAQAMLAQANQAPQGVLQLLR